MVSLEIIDFIGRPIARYSGENVVLYRLGDLQRYVDKFNKFNETKTGATKVFGCLALVEWGEDSKCTVLETLGLVYA